MSTLQVGQTKCDDHSIPDASAGNVQLQWNLQLQWNPVKLVE